MNYRMMTVAALLVALPACAQKKKAVINDSNTPLHLLQPAYQGTYGDLTPEQVKKDIDRVFAYIDKETPARVVDKNTGKVITDYTAMGDEAQLERGAFRLRFKKRGGKGPRHKALPGAAGPAQGARRAGPL